MNPVVKMLVVWLAVLSVGAVELFGARVGYFCACTGEISPVMTCEEAVCHPDDAHAHACASENEHAEHGDAECPGSSGDQDHSHQEVVESLPLTTRPSQPVASFSVCLDLAVAMQLSFLDVAFSLPCTEFERTGRPRPPDDRCPPTAQVVTRTTVMLV